MQAQEDGTLIPFAKCSREVSRSLPCSSLSQSCGSMPQKYGDVFWKTLSQRPNPNWMEEQYFPPVLRATGCSQSAQYPLDVLPPPEMLWRRKRRKPPLERMQQGPGTVPARVRAVTSHLEDLRRRQTTINALKAAQWGSSEPAPAPPVLEGEGCGFFSTERHPDLGEGTLPTRRGHFVTPGRAQLLWSPWSPLGQEGACAPGQLSSLAYSTVTARRNPTYSSRGAEQQSEE